MTRARAAVGGPGVRRFVVAAVAACAAGAAPAVPTFADVKSAYRPSDVVVVDRQGRPLQTVRVDANERRLAWQPLADVSPALLAAVLQSEDKRFWSHDGVDWKAVAGSAWANTVDTKTRGASTLTMQLAGLVDPALARPAGGRSVAGKLQQAWLASRLEATWKKSEILEAYLNLVPYRGEQVGIEALAQTAFLKHASGLDAQEAAIAAVLVRGPNAKPAAVAERACALLRTQGADCRGVVAVAETALARRGGMPLGEQLAPHAARRLLADRPDAARTPLSTSPSSAAATTARSPLVVAFDATPARPVAASPVASTLDAPLQRFAVETLRRRLAELAGRNVEDGAVVVLDNASGEVLAWVGSSGDRSGAAAVDGVVARRQPGSTLKPFVYELAFERRYLTPATLVDDSPAELRTGNGLYRPQNYDHDWKGFVSARTALGASLNVPAVRVGAMVGTDALHERLQRLGFALPESAGWYGAALALGSADVTLLALTNAYRTLANGGVASAPSLVPSPARKAGDGVRVMEPAAAFLVADILADDNARVRTFGASSLLATRGWAAVKTGTSKDMRDNWCVGFTDRYTVGVWVGNASGQPMHAVSGTSGAAPVWHAVVARLHAGAPSKAPVPPAGVVQARIAYEGGREASRPEWFLAGTERALQRTTDRDALIGIASPQDGSVFALDPDIPPAAQRIVFEGEAGRWWIDGRPIGSGPRVSWAPWPGRHRLTLRSPSRETIQTVSFDVRGAGVRRRP